MFIVLIYYVCKKTTYNNNVLDNRNNYLASNELILCTKNTRATEFTSQYYPEYQHQDLLTKVYFLI